MKSIKPIYFLIGAIILMILVNTIFFLNQFYTNQKNYVFANRTRQAIAYTNLLENMILNAETGQRGFLITSDTVYLNPYNLAVNNISTTYQKLFSIISKHPLQAEKLEKLNQSVNLKIAELHRSIELHKKGKFNESHNLIKSNVGNNLTEEIRILIDEIKRTEASFLEANNRIIDKVNFRLQIFLIISNWVLLVIVISALINIIRNRQQIAALFTQVTKKRELLETQKTELQSLSQGLIKQNAELERFAYVASHDLRSPAVNQIALLDLFAVAKSDTERANLFENMKEVAQSLSTKLDDLIESLRSKYESNELQQNLKFEEIYQSVVRNLTADIRETNAEIVCDFSSAPEIHLPKSYLESILQNLLSNALKYRHPDRKPVIALQTFRNGQRTCFKISDNGLGIDLKKNGNNIFGLYKTFHENHDSKGVGLYITKAQVVAMGGSIQVDSTPDVGTTFTICL